MNEIARFQHWFGDNYELYAMFLLPNGSTVSINQVQMNHEIPPPYIQWVKEVEAGRRCRQCWGPHPQQNHDRLGI